MLNTLDSGLDSEEYLEDYVEEYVKFGVKITNNKTKLGKRVYIMITLISILILTFDILEEHTDLKKNLNTLIKDNLAIVIIMGLTLFILIIIFPERNNITILFVSFIWVLWIFYFSLLISFLLKFWTNSNFCYSLFVIHQFLITFYCLLKEEFNFDILYANLILSFFGIVFILVQKFWVFEDSTYLFLLCIQYFLVNSFYFLLVIYSMKFHQKRFWRKRKGLISLLIFIMANFTIFFSFLIIFYIIFWVYKNNCSFQNGDDDYDSDEEVDIDVFMSKK